MSHNSARMFPLDLTAKASPSLRLEPCIDPVRSLFGRTTRLLTRSPWTGARRRRPARKCRPFRKHAPRPPPHCTAACAAARPPPVHRAATRPEPGEDNGRLRSKYMARRGSTTALHTLPCCSSGLPRPVVNPPAKEAPPAVRGGGGGTCTPTAAQRRRMKSAPATPVSALGSAASASAASAGSCTPTARSSYEAYEERALPALRQ